MKTIISVCLLLVALPSFAEDYWGDRSERERNLAQGASKTITIKEIYKGKFTCHGCSTANNYADYMWAALLKLDLIAGESVNIYSPGGKLITVNVGLAIYDGASASGTIVTPVFTGTVSVGITDDTQVFLRRAGSIMNPSKYEDVFKKTTLQAERAVSNGKYTLVNKYDAVTVYRAPARPAYNPYLGWSIYNWIRFY